MQFVTASGKTVAQEEKRLDWDASGNLLFKGVHPVLGADPAAGGWLIWKFTWDLSGNLSLKQGPLTGTWENRAALSW
jgi:hypothetical protein